MCHGSMAWIPSPQVCPYRTLGLAAFLGTKHVRYPPKQLEFLEYFLFIIVDSPKLQAQYCALQLYQTSGKWKNLHSNMFFLLHVRQMFGCLVSCPSNLIMIFVISYQGFFFIIQWKLNNLRGIYSKIMFQNKR